MKIFSIGASRNIGYFATSALLKDGHSVTFLLRNPNIFDKDDIMQPFVQSKQAKLVKGDALVLEDVQKAWNEASVDGPVDLVMFTLGGTPTFSITKGFVTSPPDLCTSSLLNVLSVIPRSSPQPRLLTLSSNGITQTEHKKLPLPVKAFHSMLKVPHADKLGLERVMEYTKGGAPWTDVQPNEEALAPGWEARLGGEEGWLKSVVTVRPALLSDGAEKGKYRVGERLSGLYTISRRDVAHFIVTDVLPNWDKYEGKAVSIGY